MSFERELKLKKLTGPYVHLYLSGTLLIWKLCCQNFPCLLRFGIFVDLLILQSDHHGFGIFVDILISSK